MSTLGAQISERIHKVGPGLHKIVENISWLIVDRAVRMGMGLIVGVWVARYLGPDQFGSLNFAIAFVALFATIASLGLEGIIVRELIDVPEETNQVLGTAFVLRCLGAILGIATSIAVLHLIQPGDKRALLLVSILSLTLVFQAFDTIDSFFQSQVRSKITVWAKNGSFLVFAAVRISLILCKAPLWTFAAAMSGEIAMGALGLIIGYRFSEGMISAWQANRRVAARLIRQSWPIIFSGMAIMIYMRLDMVMLKMMQGDSAVGIYSAATRISEVWYFIPLAIVSSVAPAIMKVKDDPILFGLRMQRLFSLMSVLALSTGSLIALASHFIVRSLYSNSFRNAAPIVAIHVWASVFVFLGTAQSPWDWSKNLTKLSLYRTLCGAVINVLMNLYLIPKYSAVGAAIATVVSYAISNVFLNWFSLRTRPVFYMQMRSFISYDFWRLSA